MAMPSPRGRRAAVTTVIAIGALTCGVSIAARGRRLDDDRFAGVEHGGVAGLAAFRRGRPCAAPNSRRPDRLRRRRGRTAARGGGRTGWCSPSFPGSGWCARTPSPAFHWPRPPEPFADVEILQQHRIAEFQHFRIGEPRVGHVRVHGVGAGEAGTGRRAGADRLVILIAALPKLRLFMVPCAAASAPSAPNRQLVTACEVSTLPATTAAGYSGDSIELRRDDDVDRPQAAGVHRDVVVDHDAEHVEHGRARHRLGRVEVRRPAAARCR